MSVENISLDGFVMRRLNIVLQCRLFHYWKNQVLSLSK